MFVLLAVAITAVFVARKHLQRPLHQIRDRVLQRLSLATVEAGWLLCLPPAAAAPVLCCLDERDRRALRLVSRVACVQVDAYVRRLVVGPADADALSRGVVNVLYPNLKELHLILNDGEFRPRRGWVGRFVSPQALLNLLRCCDSLLLLQRIVIQQSSNSDQPSRLVSRRTWQALVCQLPAALPELSIDADCFSRSSPAVAGICDVASALQILTCLRPCIHVRLEGEVRWSALARCQPALQLGPAPAHTLSLTSITHVLLNVDIVADASAATLVEACGAQLVSMSACQSLGLAFTSAPLRHSTTDLAMEQTTLFFLCCLQPLPQLRSLHLDCCTLDAQHLHVLQLLPSLTSLEVEAVLLPAKLQEVGALSAVTRLALGSFTWLAEQPAAAAQGVAASLFPALHVLMYGHLPCRRRLRSRGLDTAILLPLLTGAAHLQCLTITADSLVGAGVLAELGALSELRLDTPDTVGMLAALTACRHLARLQVGPNCSLQGSSARSVRSARADLVRLLSHGSLAGLEALRAEGTEFALLSVLLQHAPPGLQRLELCQVAGMEEAALWLWAAERPAVRRIEARGCAGIGPDFMLRLPSVLQRPWLATHWAALLHDSLNQ